MVQLELNSIAFPDPYLYDPLQGLIAYGGDLSVERLHFAYKIGIFPWYNEDEEILWWCPDPRFVLFPERLRISKSMKKILDRNVFTFTENKCFEDVMKACQQVNRKDQDGTWINNQLIESFKTLHQYGIAKSYEVWQNDQLVGGFYGLKIGRVFCGESMFSVVSNASKAAFINFCLQNKTEVDLIDCQIHSDHLESLGAEMIDKIQYLDILKQQTNES